MKTRNAAPGPVELRARARRFELRIALRYRTCGEGKWHRGYIRNVSHTGVLFQSEDCAEPRTPLEITFSLARENWARRAAEVVCRGTVTRSERRGSELGGPVIAATISHYRFVRP